MLQHHPPAIAQDHGFAEMAQRGLPKKVVVAQPRAAQVVVVGRVGQLLDAPGFARLRAGELHRLDRRQRVLYSHRDVLPHLVVLAHARLQALHRALRDQRVRRQHDQRRQRQPPVLRQHDRADADQAQRFRDDLLRECRDDRGHLVRLVDALRQAAARSPREERERQAQDVAEGGLNQPRFDLAGRDRALVVGRQRQPVTGDADHKQQSDRPEERRNGLAAGARRDRVGAVRQPRTAGLLQLRVLPPMQRGDVYAFARGSRRLDHGALDEQPGHIVDRGPVDQRLQQIGTGGEQGQTGDDQKPFPVRPRQLEQRMGNAGRRTRRFRFTHSNPDDTT